MGTREVQMAKVQKTFYLNDDLERVVDALSSSTGASFTKIVTAALIRYILGDFPTPDPEWMKQAVALERGEISLPRLLLRCYDHKMATLDLKAFEAGKVKGDPIEFIKLESKFHKGSKRNVEQRLDNSEDPLAELIQMLTDRPKGDVRPQ